MSAPEVAGLREALRDLLLAFCASRNFPGGIAPYTELIERVHVALRDRAGVPPPQDRADAEVSQRGSSTIEHVEELRTDEPWLTEMEAFLEIATRSATSWRDYARTLEAAGTRVIAEIWGDIPAQDGCCGDCEAILAWRELVLASSTSRPAPVPLSRAPQDRAALGGVPAESEGRTESEEV